MTIEVDKEIKLTQLEPSDAKDIFATIDSQRDYLGKWLPCNYLLQQNLSHG